MPNHHLHIVSSSDVGNKPDIVNFRDNDFLDDFEPTGRAIFFTWTMIVMLSVGCIMIGFAALSTWAKVYPL